MLSWLNQDTTYSESDPSNVSVHLLVEEHLNAFLQRVAQKRKQNLEIIARLEAQYARLTDRVAKLEAAEVLDEGTYLFVRQRIWGNRLLLGGVMLLALLLPTLRLPLFQVPLPPTQILLSITILLASVLLTGAGVFVISRILHLRQRDFFYNADERSHHHFTLRTWILLFAGIEIGLAALVVLATPGVDSTGTLLFAVTSGFLAILLPIVGGFLHARSSQWFEAYKRTSVLRRIERRRAQLEVSLHKDASSEYNAFQIECLKAWKTLQQTLEQRQEEKVPTHASPITFDAFHREAMARYQHQRPSVGDNELVDDNEPVDDDEPNKTTDASRSSSVPEPLPEYAGNGNSHKADIPT